MEKELPNWPTSIPSESQRKTKLLEEAIPHRPGKLNFKAGDISLPPPFNKEYNKTDLQTKKKVLPAPSTFQHPLGDEWWIQANYFSDLLEVSNSNAKLNWFD